jgi:hypothetical protein
MTMTRRLRLILPALEVVVACVAAYLLLELPFAIIWLVWGVAVPPEKHPSDLLLILYATFYGAYRVAAFHPFYRPEYREWLARTPWTSRKPLPVGPVGWVGEDLLIVAGLAALTQVNRHLDPVLLGTIPLMSHGLVLTASLFPTGCWGFGYASAFALGLAVWLGPSRWAFLAAAVGVNVLSHVGYRRSLARFPWSALEWQEPWRLGWSGIFLTKIGENPSRPACGWPYDRLRPDPADSPRIDRVDALLVSLLAGWWLFAASSLISDRSARIMVLSGALSIGTWAAFLSRLVLYCQGYAPPINLLGRIFTFRWIIPGYDKVLIGPVCTVVAPVLGIVTLRRWGVPLDIALPFGFSLMLFVALSAGPSLQRWRLTGQHRIVPSQQQPKSEFIPVG